jgi:hypothetical protein
MFDPFGDRAKHLNALVDELLSHGQVTPARFAQVVGLPLATD